MSRNFRLNFGMRGFSLVEMMISLLIGAIIILAVVRVFIGTNRNSEINSSLARVQEVGRGAVPDVQREIRMAGHMGCVNAPGRLRNGELFNHLPGTSEGTVFTGNNWVSDFSRPIQGYEAASTAPGGTLDLGVTGTGTWTPTLPSFLTGRVSRGSDVVVVRYLGPRAIPVTNITLGGNPTVTMPAGTSGFIQAGRAYALGDCNRLSLFVPSNITASGFRAQGVTGAEPYSSGEAYVYEARMVAFFVGPNTVGSTSLYRMQLNPNGVAPLIEELQDGVTSLQAVYGWDTHTPLPDGAVDTFGTGNTLATATVNGERAEWRTGQVRLGMLVEVPRDGRPLTDRTTRPVVGVTITPAAGDPIRSSFETSIAIRNNLFAY